MWKPAIPMPLFPGPAALRLTEPTFADYALGWDVQDYRGARIIWHGGAVLGFKAAVVMLPDRNVGFATDWPARWAAVTKERFAEGLKTLRAAAATSAKVGPSLPPARYAGTYADPWYGRVEVAAAADRLRIDFTSTPRMGERLEHHQYDTFVTCFDDKTIEPAYVTFALNADGKIDRVAMKATLPIAIFSWDYRDLLFTPMTPVR